MDRESFLDAWSGTDNTQVVGDTSAEIARFQALKGKAFKEALDADREGVRLALLSAEFWFSGVQVAQVGREKRKAATMYRRVHDLRSKTFGRTRLEAMVESAVAVPIHMAGELLKSGLAPTEFLATLNK